MKPKPPFSTNRATIFERRLAAIQMELDLKRSNPNLLALDADGVLLDYHGAYAKAWERAFGARPQVVDPLAYWPMDRYGVSRLGAKELARFRQFRDDEFWATIDPMPGALEATQMLADAGYDLVCLTAIKPQHEAARARNLAAIGFPIKEVISAHGEAMARSPKADALERLMPAAFVDDYLPYLRGAPDQIHTALILREPNGSPNQGPELSLAKSTHSNLLDFARFWVSREHP